jgi:translation elongation factor P/translation initiation factor 5A
MDQETFEQMPLNEATLAGPSFVKKNMVVKFLIFKGNVFGVEAPTLWN